MPKKVRLKNVTMLVTVKAPADMPAADVRERIKAMTRTITITPVKVTAYKKPEPLAP